MSGGEQMSRGSTREDRFRARLEWAGDGRHPGSATIGGQVVEVSAPGLAAGAGPEDLLAGAAGAGYGIALADRLHAAGLPYQRLRVETEAVVHNDAGAPALAHIRIGPAVLGGDRARAEEYRIAAGAAAEASTVLRHLRPDLTCEVGDIAFGEGDEDGGANLLDVRSIPPPRRHQLIFGLLDRLPPGEALVLINDHDPLPLRYQLEATRESAYGWEYLEEGHVAGAHHPADVSEALVADLGRLLDRALRRLGEAGQAEEACRIAAAAWALVEGTRPREARRFDGTLHYLTLGPARRAGAPGRPASPSLDRRPRPGADADRLLRSRPGRAGPSSGPAGHRAAPAPRGGNQG
jgi:organic hydroperoxide reductase OsmC/OhrA